MKVNGKKLQLIALVIFGLFYLSFDNYNESLLSSIAEKLQNYSATYPIQKVYVHRDQPYYVSNENINFTAYIVNGAQFRPSDAGVLYLELLGPDNQPIVQQKFIYKNGITYGKLVLPYGINSGEYKLLAYTSWMKNFDTNLIFNEKIKIFSPRNYKKLNLPLLYDDFQLNFHPEGGTFIENLANNVGLEVLNKYGKSIQLDGAIYDNNGLKVTSFKTNELGIGVFVLKPESGKTYYAKVQYKNTSKKFALPKAKVEGSKMQVRNSHPHYAKVIVQTKGLAESDFLLVAQANNHIYYAVEGNSSNGNFIASIPKNKLPKGITQIALFDEKANVVCERLIFIEKHESGTPAISIHNMDNRQREEISINVSKRPSTFSVSINSFELPSTNIYSYLLLVSELQGDITNPNYYFDENNTDAQSALDNLLMTKKLIRFKWEDILKKDIASPKYSNETGLSISGLLTKISSEDTLRNLKISLSIPEESIAYEAKSDQNGNINAYINIFSNTKRIFIQPLENALLKNNVKLNINDGFLKHVELKTSESTIDNEDTMVNIETLLENQRISDAFGIYPNESGVNNNYLYPNDYSNMYDSYVLMADYIEFSDMRDVFREIVPGVSISLKKNNLRVYSKENERSFDDLPLFLVNQIPTMDIEYILKIKPSNVESIGKISSLNNINHFGLAGENGIVCINLKKDQKSENVPLDKNAISMVGLNSSENTFITKSYTTVTSQKKPNFRSQLYWNPFVKTDWQNSTDLNFHTTDQTGTYQISIQGITSEGTPFSINKNFTVL